MITWVQVTGAEVHVAHVERMHLSVSKDGRYHWNVSMFGVTVAYGMTDDEAAAKAAAVNGAILKLRAKLQYLGDTDELFRSDADVVTLQAEVLRLANRNEDIEKRLTEVHQIVATMDDILFPLRIRLNFTPDAHGKPFYRDQPLAPELDVLVTQVSRLRENLEISENAALPIDK